MNIDKVLDELSLQQKVRLLSGRDFWHTEEIEDPFIPAITVSDGPHGLRLAMLEEVETESTVTYPVEAAMAATWNQELIEEVGSCIGEEAQYFNIGVLLAPGTNGKRSPAGGRNFEYFSEDPYLSGKMASAYVRGVQGQGVGTSLKHYVANEQETNRMVVSSEVDERTLREIYLRPFEMVVKNEEPWTIMCSYNKVNGTYMSQNKKYLTEILREEWGFSGLIVSDWGAVAQRARGIEAGLDLEMPGPGRQDEKVIAAIRSGEISEEVLNERVKTLLQLVDRVQKNQSTVVECDFEVHHEVARRVAAEATVLLKNEGDILPLNPEQDIAVIGKLAEEPRFQGGGSSHIVPSHLERPLQEIKEYTSVEYVSAYGDDGTSLKDALAAAEGKDAVIIFIGTTGEMESEGYDRKNIELPPEQIEVVEAVAKVNKNVITITASGSAVDLNRVETSSRGLLHGWLSGQAGAGALAAILFGDVNPSGKLSETFPLRYENNPAYLHFPGDVERVEYREGVFTGYRYYDTKKLPVKYPFGFGLSYTEFVYSDLEVDSAARKVSFTLKNIGNRVGKETAQIYIHDRESLVRRPLKELKGFTKVEIEPGTEERVTVKLDKRAFSFYFSEVGRFVVESGEFDILVGASSRDIRLQEKIYIESDDDVKLPLTVNHSLKTFLEDPEMKNKAEEVIDKIGLDDDNRFYSVSLHMPVRKVLDILQIDEEIRNEVNNILGFVD